MSHLTAIEQYRSFCDERLDVPLFNQAAWLDVVAPGSWDVALSLDKERNILGSLPYSFKKILGIHIVQQPELTSHFKLLMYPYDNITKAVKMRATERKILSDLIRQLPRALVFKMVLATDREYYLPFNWYGYRLSPRYTYIYHYPLAHKEVDASIKYVVRRNVRISREKYEIITINEWEPFWRFYSEFYRSRKLPYVSKSKFQGIFQMLSISESLLCLAAINQKGAWCSSLLVGMDNRTAYLLITCQKDRTSESPISLLIVEALERLKGRVEYFDFDGSQKESIELFLSAFTGHTRQMMQVTGCNYMLPRFFLQGLGKI